MAFDTTELGYLSCYTRTYFLLVQKGVSTPANAIGNVLWVSRCFEHSDEGRKSVLFGMVAWILLALDELSEDNMLGAQDLACVDAFRQHRAGILGALPAERTS